MVDTKQIDDAIAVLHAMRTRLSAALDDAHHWQQQTVEAEKGWAQQGAQCTKLDAEVTSLRARLRILEEVTTPRPIEEIPLGEALGWHSFHKKWNRIYPSHHDTVHSYRGRLLLNDYRWFLPIPEAPAGESILETPPTEEER